MKEKIHSIVVPVYQSCEILESLVSQVSSVMNSAGLAFEMLLIDDGSKDGSFEKIKQLASKYKFVKGFKLSRNFGHQAALTIGLKECAGEYIAIIDDDLQDPPEILPDFFKALTDGAEVVYGIRRKRKEGIVKKLLYAGFYRLLKVLASIDIPLDSGDFCVMKRSVVDAMLQLNESKPFLRGTRAWVGFKQIGMEYERNSRYQGGSGYTLRKYFSLALTGMLMFSYLPLRIASFLGFFIASISFLYALFVIISSFFVQIDVAGYKSLIVIILFLGGVQLASLGIIGEYLARLNDNVRSWPIAIISDTTAKEKL